MLSHGALLSPQGETVLERAYPDTAATPQESQMMRMYEETVPSAPLLHLAVEFTQG